MTEKVTFTTNVRYTGASGDKGIDSVKCLILMQQMIHRGHSEEENKGIKRESVLYSSNTDQRAGKPPNIRSKISSDKSHYPFGCKY